MSSAWSGLRGWMLFVSAVAIVIAALAVLLPRLPSPVSEPYTQLALRGRWAAVNTVALARPGRALRVDLAVVNRTHERHRYRLVPRLPGGRGWAARTVTLRPGERWAGSVYGTVPRRGCLHRLVVGLHGAAGDRVAAEVLTLWVRSSEVPDARCGPL